MSIMSTFKVLLSFSLFTLICSFELDASLKKFNPKQFSYFSRPEYRPQNVINSLLTGVSPLFPRTECYASADNRAGVCMAKTACLSSGGTIASNCGHMSIGACCVYQGSCRANINANETYFVSPSYPNIHTERLDPPVCIFTLQRDNLIQKWPVCQIRIDFDEFALAPPINGTCGGRTDAFVISGASNFNATGLPEKGICGDLSGQHMYINVDPDDTTEPLLMVVDTSNEQRYPRKWSIRIRQVPCTSPFKAPPGCLQFHSTSQGTIESFNFKGMNRGRPSGGLAGTNYQYPGGPSGTQFDPSSPISQQQNFQIQNLFPNPNYFSGMSYGICIAQQPKSCGIKWEASEMDIGGTFKDKSGVGSSSNNNFGCVQSSDTISDIGDYLMVPGGSRDGISRLEHLFCGQKLNPIADQTYNKAVISYFKPFNMYVKTDNLAANGLGGAQDQKGFQINYKLITCN